jgi:P-type Cu2+ transporter
VTRPDAIEMLASATHFVFDKTGTLTDGKMRVVGVTSLTELSTHHCLSIARALQFGSEHPIGRAISAVPVTGSETLTADKITNAPGCGVEGEINGETYRIGTIDFVSQITKHADGTDDVSENMTTTVLLANKYRPLARITLQHTLRQDAQLLINALRWLGKEIILLSGDAVAPAREAAARLNIEHWFAEMTPKTKLDFVRGLQRNGAIVAMIGDGINDAPVLAGADVSIALSNGTDLAKIHADMVMLGASLMALYCGILTARRGLQIIRQNLVWAFAYNFTAIPLAAFGWVSPWMAALGMSASSLLVVLNALRLSASDTNQPLTFPADSVPEKS